MKTLKDLTGDSLEQMIDFKVVDQDGDALGTLHSLWSDPTTGAVEFLGVKTGWIFGHNHVVPAEKAQLDESENVVRLPYTSLFVKEAPSMSADAEISEAEEENIFRYYGIDRPVEMGVVTTGASAETPVAAVETSSPNDTATEDSLSPSRLRRTIRSAGLGSPSAGAAVRGALDDLVPGDSSSRGNILHTAATPGSYGTTNLYGSTGSVTPVENDSLGEDIDTTSGESNKGATH